MQGVRDFAPAGPLRAFGYRLLWTCSDSFQKAANACLYVAAGLLRQTDLKAASQARWRPFNASADEVDAGLEVWERRLYGNLLRPADRVLLVGCGAGRDLIALRQMGCDVTGIEQTPELVELGREHLARHDVTATLLTGFVETLEVDGRYDAVIFSNGCYSCLPQSESRVATLTRMEQLLSPDGRIIVTYPPLGHQSPSSVRLIRIGARLGRADWRPESGDSFTRDHPARRLLRYEHLFHPGEVVSECASAGLRVICDEETAASSFRYAVAVSLKIRTL